MKASAVTKSKEGTRSSECNKIHDNCFYSKSKALFIENLFKLALRWILTSTATLYGAWEKDVQWKRPELCCRCIWLLHNDNVPAHTSLRMRQCFDRKQLGGLSYTLCSSWPSHLWFCFVPKNEIEAKGPLLWHFRWHQKGIAGSIGQPWGKRTSVL